MKALINALTLALIYDGKKPEDAKVFAESFVADNAELLSAPAAKAPTGRVQPEESRMSPTRPVVEGDDNIERARVMRVPVQGPDGLTDEQRAAVGNVGLCSNCQQPNNHHLPGCAVASGENPRAVTKDPLPPVQ